MFRHHPELPNARQHGWESQFLCFHKDFSGHQEANMAQNGCTHESNDRDCKELASLQTPSSLPKSITCDAEESLQSPWQAKTQDLSHSCGEHELLTTNLGGCRDPDRRRHLLIIQAQVALQGLTTILIANPHPHNDSESSPQSQGHCQHHHTW